MLTYLLLELWSQIIIRKDVEDNLCPSEQHSRFEQYEGLCESVATGNHHQMHDGSLGVILRNSLFSVKNNNPAITSKPTYSQPSSHLKKQTSKLAL